jgi:hypothetical protein
MNQQQQQQPGMFQQAKWAFGWLLFICNSLAVSVEVFLHKGVGSRYIGLQGLAAAAMIFFWGGFWPGQDISPVLIYLALYLLFCFAQRMDALKRLRQGGGQEHSRYTGRPILMRFTGRINEITIKRIVEPALVFLIGILICSANEPLGKYLMLAAVGLLVSVQSTLRFEETRATDMNDAMINQQHAAQRFREMRGEDFLN